MEGSNFLQLLRSRKFWALIIALLTIVAGYATGQVDAWQAIQAAVAALAAYSTGVAIEDAGAKSGASQISAPAQPAPADIPVSGIQESAIQSTSGIPGPPSLGDSHSRSISDRIYTE